MTPAKWTQRHNYLKGSSLPGYTIVDFIPLSLLLCFPDGSDGKASACNAGDPGLIPGLGRSHAEGNGNPLQYCCLENPMDRGAWWATVHGVAQSRTQLKRLSTRAWPRMFLSCRVFHLDNSHLFFKNLPLESWGQFSRSVWVRGPQAYKFYM